MTLGTGETTDLTPFEGVRARIQAVSHEFPDEILIALNDRDPAHHDIHRLNITTGEKSLVMEHEGFDFTTDDEYNVRFAERLTSGGGKEILKATEAGGWEPFMEIAMEDSYTTAITGFDKTGTILHMTDSRDRNTVAFINAGNLEWGGKMNDDLIDGVNWTVQEGIADPDQVAIMGGSYGGYATLWGMTNTPDTFACGVDLVGISNLTSFIELMPPYIKQDSMELIATRIGDPRTEEGRAFLAERSPLSYADQIKKPLQISQGANDPRVRKEESDQIVQAMQDANIPVTYLLYTDEGHGFERPENRQLFFAVAEAFLAEHLGGRYELIGDDFEGSSLTVPVGAEEVPGLAEALSE